MHGESCQMPRLCRTHQVSCCPARVDIASGIACDMSGGRFGPFQEHLFVGDQHHSNLTRVVLEKVDGRYQGVCIPFKWGFSSGIVPTKQAPDGSCREAHGERGEWRARVDWRQEDRSSGEFLRADGVG